MAATDTDRARAEPAERDDVSGGGQPGSDHSARGAGVFADVPDSSAVAKPLASRSWHALAPLDVARELDVDATVGLSAAQARERRTRYGANALQRVMRRPAWRLLADQFASVIVALLGAAAFVAWLAGDAAEAIAILVVLALNAAVGFAMEWQAGRALDALRRQASTVARVRREGRDRLCDAVDIVPGDVVSLNAGDRVPADARIVSSAGALADESPLTGESHPVEKNPEAVPEAAPLPERGSMLYLGTTVVAGRAAAVVTATGLRTEIGRVGLLVSSAPDETTPLERHLDDLGRRLVYLVVAVAVVVMMAGGLRGMNAWLMVEVAISLAVAAVPEGLPAVVTLVLAFGVLRMARERAIVRRLPAVETLGSTTVICTDKTGTLTENRMTVRAYALADGSVVELGDPVRGEAGALLGRALRAGVLCNEASLDEAEGGEPRTVGDPTETALLEAARRLGVGVNAERGRWQQVETQPFSAATKRMTTMHDTPEGARLAVLKGAPGVVLDACSFFASGVGPDEPLAPPARARFLRVNAGLAARALRVLALAEKHLGDGADTIEDGYTFLGFVGMSDPVRPGVAVAIERARRAGIRTVMLTGDQADTARAIARELRLGAATEPRTVHASALARAEGGAILDLARSADVFARVSPEDKFRIVESLQRSGEVVAVTGDGINDAPALKRADIGIAMGARGTEVAKEASDIVLTDDNFSTIVGAIERGRAIYENIQKFVHFLFSCNLAEVLVIFAAITAGWPLPLLPLQILWLNIVTDVFPALALAMEAPASDVMDRRPRAREEALLSHAFLARVACEGALLAGITLAAYSWALGRYGEGPQARTVALLALVGVQVGQALNCRSRRRSAFVGLRRAPFVVAAVAVVAGLQIAAVSWQPLASVLGTGVPDAIDWMVTLAATAGMIAIVEAGKALAGRRRGTLERRGSAGGLQHDLGTRRAQPRHRG
jgi:Ca2+-transporting ATPase